VVTPALAKAAPDGTPLLVPAAPFDVLVELRPAEGALAQAVMAALGPAPVFDGSRSAVLAGVEHTVLPGRGGACAVGLVRRRADLDRAAFTAHWRDRHVEFARRVSGGAGYRQLHADPAASAALAGRLGIREAGLDGAGLLFFDDLAAMTRVRASPQVRRDATEDEMRFVDHARSHFFAVRECAGDAGG
jgi:hypothetical protein